MALTNAQRRKRKARRQARRAEENNTTFQPGGRNGDDNNQAITGGFDSFVGGGGQDQTAPTVRFTKNPRTSDHDKRLARITNREFRNYKKNFLKVEKKTIKDITDEEAGNEAADQALEDSRAGFDRQAASLDRGLARTGTQVNAQQQAKIDSTRGLGRATASVGAANLARRSQNAENDAAITEMVQAGQSLRGVALQGLSAAANMGAQRDAAGDALDAQKKQSTMSNVAAGAAIGTTIAPGWGTAIGAGVGLMVSMF